MLNQEVIRVLPQLGHGNFLVTSAAFMPSKKILTTLDTNGSLIFWDIRSGKQMRQMRFEGIGTLMYKVDGKNCPITAAKPWRLKVSGDQLYIYGATKVYSISDIDANPKEVFKLKPDMINGFLTDDASAYIAIRNRPGGSRTLSQDVVIHQDGKDSIIKLGSFILPDDSDFKRFTEHKHLQGTAYAPEQQRAAVAYEVKDMLHMEYMPDWQQFDIWGGKTKRREVALFDTSQSPVQLLNRISIDPDVLYWLSPKADLVRWIKKGIIWRKPLDSDDLERKEINLRDCLPKGEKLKEVLAFCVGTGEATDDLMAVILETSSGYILQVWGINKGKILLHWSLEKPLQPLAFSTDGQYLVLGSEAGPIHLWNLQNGALERMFYASMPKILHLSLQQDNVVNFAFANNTLYNLRFAEGVRFKQTGQWHNPVRKAVMSRNNAFVNEQGDRMQLSEMTALIDQAAPNKVVLLFGDRFSPYLPRNSKAAIKQMTLSADGRFLAILLDNSRNTIYIIDTDPFSDQASATYDELARWELPGAQDIAFHPETNDLLVGVLRKNEEDNLYLYRWQEQDVDADDQELQPLWRHSFDFEWSDDWKRIFPKLTIAFSETGQYLIFQLQWSTPTIALLKETNQKKGIYQELFPVILGNSGRAKKTDSALRKLLAKTDALQIFGNDELIVFSENRGKGYSFYKMLDLEEWLKRKDEKRQSPYRRISRKHLKFISADRFAVAQDPSLLFLWKEGEDCVYVVNWMNKFGAITWLFPCNEEKFLMVSRHNYYYSTPDGYDLIAFQLGDEVYPSEQFDVLYNKPHRLLERMGVLDRKKEKNSELLDLFAAAYQKRLSKLFEKVPEPNRQKLIDQIDSQEDTEKQLGLLPTIEILNKDQIPGSTAELEHEFDIQVPDPNVKVKTNDEVISLLKLSVFVNGVPIHGMVQIDGKEGPIQGREGLNLAERDRSDLRAKIRLRLSPGLNKVDVSVTNIHGLESFRDTYYIQYVGNRTQTRLYIITIGVDTYIKDSGKNLNFAKSDALALAKALSGIATASGRFDEVMEPSILLDDEVTSEQIEAQVGTYLANATEDDCVIVAYSGHGLLGSKFDFYLATHDTDFANPAERGISLEMVDNLLDAIPARNKLVLLDACHSGEFDKEAAKKKEAKSTVKISGVKFRNGDHDIEITDKAFQTMQALFVDLRRGAGATVISASAGDQKAREREDLEHGVFTNCLLEALGIREAKDLRNAVLPDGPLRISDLSRYLIQRVPEVAGNSQRPTVRTENISNDWQIK